MAITVIQAPNATIYQESLHTPLWHVVTSTNSGNTDFRFVFDVNILTSSLAVIPVGRFKVSPDASGRGVIDLSRVARAGLVNYFTPTPSTPPVAIDTDDVAVTYVVGYGEEYSTAGVLSVYPSLISNPHRANNDYSPDMVSNGAPDFPTLVFNEWATSRNKADVWVPRDSKAFMSYLNLGRGNFKVEVQEITADSVPVGTPSLSGLLGMSRQLQVYNLNADDLNAVTYASGPATPVPAGAAGYRIRVVDPAHPTLGTWAYVRFLCEPKTPATAVHFLNRFGGFDTFFFTGPTRRELDVDRKLFQRTGAVSSNDGSGPKLREFDANTQVYADTTTVFNTKHSWARKLSSGYVDDVTHNWLWELIGSPQVYLDTNGYYFPVTIKTPRWTEKRTRFDKMYNLELEVTMNRQVFAQTR